MQLNYLIFVLAVIDGNPFTFGAGTGVVISFGRRLRVHAVHMVMAALPSKIFVKVGQRCNDVLLKPTSDEEKHIGGYNHTPYFRGEIHKLTILANVFLDLNYIFNTSLF